MQKCGLWIWDTDIITDFELLLSLCGINYGSFRHFKCTTTWLGILCSNNRTPFIFGNARSLNTRSSCLHLLRMSAELLFADLGRASFASCKISAGWFFVMLARSCTVERSEAESASLTHHERSEADALPLTMSGARLILARSWRVERGRCSLAARSGWA